SANISTSERLRVMTNRSSNRSRPPSSLRERAEAAARRSPTDVARMTAARLQQLVHELQVHQIELEMQNEELRCSQEDLADSCDRYNDLYDFAPVGYLAMDKGDVVLEANLTLATMLGVERQKLVGGKFTRFVDRDSQDPFYLHHRAVLSIGQKQTCEL